MQNRRVEMKTWRWGAGVSVLIGGLMVLMSSTTRTAAQSHLGYALRFFGAGAGDVDRVKIQIDDPANSQPGPPADVGATDFTLEFWMKARADENRADAVGCGWSVDWIYGNIVFDRDRYNQGRKFGLSLAGGRLVFGVSGEGGDFTICGATSVLDDAWHHVAMQRRRADGELWLFVDGRLEAQETGPEGDVSYPDNGVPGNHCGGPCVNSDPYLVIGAEKHDAGPEFPSYSGWIDEVRLSTALRYVSDFARPSAPFTPDANTAALYHFDEGPEGPCTGAVLDSSGASGGPSHGTCKFGGAAQSGPVYVRDTPFSAVVETAVPTDAPPTETAAPRDTPSVTQTSAPTQVAAVSDTAQPVATPTWTPMAQTAP
jgi:hypothetical protein